ncbi:MAG: cytochrome c [bacterium]|nr:cytochrome c [bacterium]
MPRPLTYISLVLVAASLIPIGMVFKSRSVRSRQETRIQVVYDMDSQFHFRAQSENPFFADGRSMRLAPEGTVARGALRNDDPFFNGTVEGDTLFVTQFPLEVDSGLLDRGQERYDIFCATCHGLTGDGNGLTHIRAAALAEGTWTPPTDLASASVIERPAGHLYNTIKNGIRNMPAYGSQIPPRDRWAIVSYVRALQLSRNATMRDVPPELRGELPR